MFYTSDVGDLGQDASMEIRPSPGSPAELEIARADPERTVYRFELTTRRFSGREGIVIDVTTWTINWLPWHPERLASTSLDSRYCVIRDTYGTVQVETVFVEPVITD